MPFTVTAVVHENIQAQELIDLLKHVGIPREQIDLTTDDAHESPRPDRVSTWSAGGLLVGMSVGGLLGWLFLPSGVPAMIGSLWCAVAGAIIGGRALGYAAADRAPDKKPRPPQVVVSVHAENRLDVKVITEALTSGHAERVAWSEDKPNNTTDHD